MNEVCDVTQLGTTAVIGVFLQSPGGTWKEHITHIKLTHKTKQCSGVSELEREN